MSLFSSDLRARAVTALMAAFPSATVDAERVDPVPSGKTPIITVYLNGENGVSAGDMTAPQFSVTATLHVELRQEGRDKAVLFAAQDAMIATARDGLLSSVAFMAPPLTDVTSYRVQRRIDGASGLYVAEALLTFELAYTDIIEPVIPDTLTEIDITIAINKPPPTVTPPEPVTVNVTIQDP